MKSCFALLLLVVTFVGCSGPGGPVQRAGRSVDNAVYDVGTGVKRTGQSIQNATN